jgi:hypothetical protein
MLIAGKPSRAVSAWLSQQGYKISHNAVARYNKIVIQPALKIGAKIQRIEQDEGNQPTDFVDKARQVSDVTQRALKASPVLQRVDWIWSEAEANVIDARSSGDIKARSSAILAANKTVENYGRAIGDPGFAPAQQLASGTTIQIAILTSPGETPKIEADSVIDVQVVDIERG